MTSTALVGPLRRHYFGGYPGVVLVANLPRDTRDIRSQACAAHRFACDCREALLAENTTELHAELKAWERAARTVVAGHRVWDWDDIENHRGNWRGDGPLACQCHGCQLVRAAHARVYAVCGDYDTGLITPEESKTP
jgi:hypothetical protein